MPLELPLIAITEEPIAEQTEEVILIVPQVEKVALPEVKNENTQVTESTESAPETTESAPEPPFVNEEPPAQIEAQALVEEEHWLSDLEDEHGETETLSLVQNYRKVCSQLEIVPVQYLIDHIEDETIRMENHGLGPRGTRALAEVFKV
jgi:hypothetical protein